MSDIRAVFFDVFGTLVDWRTSVVQQGPKITFGKNTEIDWEQFADEWRGMYQPSMESVRSNLRDWVSLDTLHRESLNVLIKRHGLTALTKYEIEELNRIWHRLIPWPDTVDGLHKIRQHYIIAPMSNGNIALMTNLSKHSGLPWDVILGAEIARQYKPRPEVYLAGASALDLQCSECVMVAAHNDDLRAARKIGFKTAFIPRPTEYGRDQKTDLEAEEAWDFTAANLLDLANRLKA
ncbi:MAG: haloacid dehalogenase type II [Pseudomonadota bacterium]